MLPEKVVDSDDEVVVGIRPTELVGPAAEICTVPPVSPAGAAAKGSAASGPAASKDSMLPAHQTSPSLRDCVRTAAGWAA